MPSAVEKISFTDSNEIERTLPTSLSGIISLPAWNQFCDDCDEAFSSHGRRLKACQAVIWIPAVIMIILNSTGWLFASNPSKFYPIAGILTAAAFMIPCHIKREMLKKPASKIRKACAHVSNYNKNLAMTLEGEESHDVQYWYIKVEFEASAYGNADDVEGGPEVFATSVDAIPVASAVPVAVAAEPVPAGPAPKKYIKNNATGKMTLNPEYTKWKKENE